jgi:thymidylate synthase
MNKLDKNYIELLKDILVNGVEKKDRTDTGTLSVFGRQIRHKMSDGFPLLTTKKIHFRSVVTELLWFLRGDTNIYYLLENKCNIWNGDAYKKYVKETREKKPLTEEEFIEGIKTNLSFSVAWGELGPIYGAQWRSWRVGDGIETSLPHPDGGNVFEAGSMYIDQIANLIKELQTNPDSRRLMVNAWNVGDLEFMTLPPCHYGFQVYTRELKLTERLRFIKQFNLLEIFEEELSISLETNPQHDIKDFRRDFCNKHNIPTRAISLMWNQRSVDTFLGLPFNIASYGLLLEIIAKAVNMVPDELIGNLGDVHLYKNHEDQANEQIGREPYELPTLNINTEFWPTESGECGIGPIDAKKVFESFFDKNFCKCLLEEDIQLINYQSHPSIKAPLSN